ncbi:MAG TPA: PDZ domain-containing protein [Negativicutes bacterium]|nr:PDZ domain-containing protein [Negativicutes bacterium]
MLTILKIAGLILEQFGSLLADELFWVILLILIFIYRKSADMENRMLGRSYSMPGKVSSSVFVGLAGGMAGSLLVILVGISMEDHTKTGGGSMMEALTYIWIIAILLAMVNPRYLCFSYAGGIVALMSLLFGFPSVNVPGLMALIGVLHLVESLLIWLDGSSYSVPLFLKRKAGETVGGYAMNRVWPIPLVVFAVAAGAPGSSGTSIAGLIDMPGWWPFLKHAAADGGSGLIYLPLMVPVVLGYGDMAVTRTPVQKCRISAARLGCYSIVLIILSVLASKLRLFAFAAAVFAPAAHELLIHYGSKEENEGDACFAAGQDGIKVLYVKKDSVADKMGIKPGDTILAANGIPTGNEEQLSEFLCRYPAFVWLDIRKPDGRLVTAEHADYRNGINSLGALVVPRNAQLYYEINNGNSPLKRLIDWLRGKHDKNLGV